MVIPYVFHVYVYEVHGVYEHDIRRHHNRSLQYHTLSNMLNSEHGLMTSLNLIQHLVRFHVEPRHMVVFFILLLLKISIKNELF